MSFAIGEVREFATGMLEARSFSGGFGGDYVHMQTVQKIWTGDRWVTLQEEGAQRTLRLASGANP